MQLNLLSMYIIMNLLEIPLFEVLYLGKENRCLHIVHHESVVIFCIVSMYQVLNGSLAESPAILDILLIDVAYRYIVL